MFQQGKTAYRIVPIRPESSRPFRSFGQDLVKVKTRRLLTNFIHRADKHPRRFSWLLSHSLPVRANFIEQSYDPDLSEDPGCGSLRGRGKFDQVGAG